MPPKIKTDKNEILEAAFEVAKSEGIESITAQSVSAVLGTSVAPIFREFQTVQELRAAIVEKIHLYHEEYLKKSPEDSSGFLRYGLLYIRFAKEYPHLFDVLTHPEYSEYYNFFKQMDGQLAFVVDSAAEKAGIDRRRAKQMFYHIWIYTHGVACLVRQGSSEITETEEREMLTAAFRAFLSLYTG